MKPSRESLHSALQTIPSNAALQLQQLLELPAHQAWPLSSTLVDNVKTMLAPDTPRQVQELYKNVWINTNSVFPRKLWLMTVNSLLPDTTGTKKTR